MKSTILILLLCFIACNQPDTVQSEKEQLSLHKSNIGQIKFSYDYQICDTCYSIIRVHVDWCTECGEITVDSGIVYLTHDILNSATALAVKDTESDFLPDNFIFINQLYFSDPNYAKTLWKDTINFTDLNKVYRLTGKITAVKRTNNSQHPRLYFKVFNAEEVDSATIKHTRN